MRLPLLCDQNVRDLAWVIGSPCLFNPRHRDGIVSDTFCQEALEEALPWLIALDAKPTPLHRFLAASPTHRLGRYFELLVEYWLRQRTGTELLASQLPYRAAHRTVGEFDFLFSHDGIATHWETAVKLYLHTGGRGLGAYIGPRARDRLDLKYAKLFDAQIRLASRVDPAWWDGPLSQPTRSCAFVKGYLFYRRGSAAPPLPMEVSASHLRGWWIHRHECESLTTVHSGWTILDRMRWLSPMALPHSGYRAPIPTRQLIGQLNSLSSAVLVAEMQETPFGLEEVSRGFIVPDDWPGSAPSVAR